jgi:bacterioferritin
MADTKKIIDALNRARMLELAAIVQYMKHHYEVEGLESPGVADMAKETALDEMKHAEAIGERVAYLGGEPTKEIGSIATGGDMKKMIQDDLAAENTAIAEYREIVKLCAAEGDTTSRRMMEQILSDEEEHANNWEGLLGVKK